jgi:hypothetical protein
VDTFGPVTTKVGIIEAIGGHPMSGLWTLQISGDMVHIESGCGVRALAACFGATEGEGDLMEKIEGQEVVYSVDGLGVLTSFTPLADWEGPDIPPEGITEDIED